MTLAEVVAMLDLPTAEDVADLLRAHGVKGRWADACCCPVATFVRCLVGERVTIGADRVSSMGGEEAVGLPPAAVKFVSRFDAADPAFADLVTP